MPLKCQICGCSRAMYCITHKYRPNVYFNVCRDCKDNCQFEIISRSLLQIIKGGKN